MAKLTEKEITNYIFKFALDKEMLRKEKFTHLAETSRDKRMKKLFQVFSSTAQSHVAEIEQEMIKLDIK
ncbi:hypothetical protein [Desulforamulus aquiferis]|uniref:Rubrerythrin diiron-binding domain-containing protein n=1 Tax=Desulforamulus aquiferis TaxID=1397668 RepID=A0AAW7ZJI3_9FIRM|nr:hypothetical protein [Desulforamulus aquiferis]MDO7789059.1 hypothetical protein [Desulforamulus aquiferis]RYD05316.1 hypothetical protein N752_10100 [Desulforamulus aquiferis]